MREEKKLDGRENIKNLDKSALEQAFLDMGEKKFRAAQVLDWLYAKGAGSFAEMSNLSKGLRTALEERFILDVPQIATKQESSDGTRKYLFSFLDNTCVEAVGIPSGEHLTVCFSTQAGCAMGCVFCSTGRGGFTRNLSCGEMFDQVRLVGEDFGMRVSNVVAMGQGEPFANYDAVLAALRLMNDEKYLGIGARHITISTCGLLDGIRSLTREPEQFTLAVSLHSAVQKTRNALMPGVAGVPLPDLKEALSFYGDTTKRRPSLEYAPIQGINDSDEELAALVAFCKGMLCHVNLIPLNPPAEGVDNRDTLSSDAEKMIPSPRIQDFKHTLEREHIEVSVRISRGADIDGACGQLSQRYLRS